MSVHPESVPINVTYFREYGIHPVKQKNGHDHDYIASFPNWTETFDALKDDLPNQGHVITPEYATAPDNIFDTTQSAELIDDRIKRVVDLTKSSDATIHLGTPTHREDPLGRTKWHNSVLSIQGGAIRSVTHKAHLLDGEHQIGIEEPLADLRRAKMGNAVLICAELHQFGFDYASNPRNALKNQDVNQVFAPAAWAAANAPGSYDAQIKESGGEESYYRQNLEKAVGSYLFKHMPTINRVIVSDKGRPDIAPYNAVIDRIH